MPYYEFKCRECGEVETVELSMVEVEPVIDYKCYAGCGGEVTRHDRVYDGYLPSIGRVPGAGGSPGR